MHGNKITGAIVICVVTSVLFNIGYAIAKQRGALPYIAPLLLDKDNGFSTTITITSLPTTDDDGNYILQWTTTGLAATPWTIQEDSNISFNNPTVYTSWDSSPPYTHSFTNKSNGTYCYRVGLSSSGPFSQPRCVIVNVPPVQPRQVTIVNSLTAGLNLTQVVQVKVSSINSFSRSDLLTDDPARCIALPGEAINRGGSRTFNITSGSNYYVFIGIGVWDLDNFFCSLGYNWFKRRYFTDINFYTWYVWVIVQVTGHNDGNWQWTISGSYLNGSLVVTPANSSPIYFNVTSGNPIP